MNYIYLILIGFIAGVINTIAGGGSVLTLPMLIFLGLPSTVANGTNRVAILIQNFFSNAGFKSKGISTFPFSIYVGISALFGSIVGAIIGSRFVKDETFNKLLGVVMVIIVLFMIFNRKKTQAKTIERVTGKPLYLQIIAFFFIGIYGGLIQAGTGFFILLALSSMGHFSLVKSNAIKAVVVILYTLSALAIYAYDGNIDYKIGFVLAIGNATGAWIGSRWSVKKGDRLVKIFLIVMVLVMAVKLWFY